MNALQRYSIVIMAGFASLVFIVFFAVLLYQRFINPPPPPEPPIHYTEAEYPPSKAIYAPGETLTYTPTLVLKVKGHTDFWRSYYDDTRDKTAVLCDGSPSPQDSFWRNLPAGSIGNARGGRTVSYVVPKMPPGKYRLQSSATKPSGGEGYYEVPFEITEPC